MNKYKEALEAMCKRCSNNFICKGTGCQPKKDLKELIERDEPKKLVKNCCPNCNWELPQSALFLKTRCWNCGQKIDWSDDE